MKFSATVLAAGFAGLMLTCSLPAAATLVLVKTNLGNFEVNLFDQTTTTDSGELSDLRQ